MASQTLQLDLFAPAQPAITQPAPGVIPEMPAGTVVKVRVPVWNEIREGVIVRMEPTCATVDWREATGWKRSVFYRGPYQILAAKIDGNWMQFS